MGGLPGTVLKPPRFLSLFSGAGGFDLGFIQAGYECAGAVDNDPYAIATHHQNFGLKAALCDLAVEPLKVADLEPVDVVIAGPPCQGFSTAGKRDFDDPRNSLLTTAGSLALLFHPKAILLENVLGALAGTHLQYWQNLTRLLVSAGYHTKDLLLNAADLGLQQTRRRVVLLAWRTSALPTVVPAQPTSSLRDVLAPGQNAADHLPTWLPAGRLLEIAKRIKPGQKLCNVRGGPNSVHTWHIPEVFGRTSEIERQVLEAMVLLRRRNKTLPTGDAESITIESITKFVGSSARSIVQGLVRRNYIRRIDRRFDLTDTFNGKFRRLSWDRPSPTVDTRFGDPRYFLHPDEHRGFTVREAARIQGFPDHFSFVGPEREKFRQIGNAVPPPVAKLLAELIQPLLE